MARLAYPGGMSQPSTGVLRRAMTRLAASAKDHEAAELREHCTLTGSTPVADITARERVTVTGTLRTVTLRPRAGVPALVADLYDGSGSISLVWLGRRQIPGIDPGRRLVCYGRVTLDHDRPVIFNPRYKLRPAGAE